MKNTNDMWKVISVKISEKRISSKQHWVDWGEKPKCPPGWDTGGRLVSDEHIAAKP